MQVINTDIIDENITYYTIKVSNKLIKVDKVIDLIDNVEDYIDKSGKFDKISFKEDVLESRTYVVKKIGNKYTCTCKNSLFNKNKPCRHILLVKNEI